MASVRSIDEGEGKGMAQARRKEAAFRAPITRIFVQQNRGGETPNAFGSGTDKTVSVETSVCLSSSVPFMRVVLGRFAMRIPALKALVKKLRGPNAGSTKYLNLSPRSICWRGRLDRGDRNGMIDGELC